MNTPRPPQLPPLPEAFALSISVHDGEHCKYPLMECMLYQSHPKEKQKLYTADQMQAYARAALEAQKAAVPELVGLTDEQCDLAIGLLDEIAREYDHYEYGLPEFFLHGVDSESDEQHKSMASRMRNAVRSGINNLPTGTASDGVEG
jgi:hypothetical protein